MNTTEAKIDIDKKGEAYLTLGNSESGEYCFIGQVDRMTTKDNRVKFVWKLPAAEHVSEFDVAVIHASNPKVVYSSEVIAPLRLDMGTKKYEVSWDV